MSAAPHGWTQCHLRDLIQIKHGFAFKGEFFGTAGPYVLVTPGNFFDEGGFKWNGDKQKRYDGPVPQDYILAAGSLIVAMTEQAEGLLGSAAIVPQGAVFLHNQRIGLVSSTAADLRYLYYLLNTPAIRKQIRATSSGAKVRHTSPSRIGEARAFIPPIDTQRRIAGILSAYDDLIDVNQRRIAILEEMARRLFDEWFVRFRYPGHEAVPLVETELGSVPEGWEPTIMGALLKLSYGRALKSDQRKPGPVAVFGSSGRVGEHDEAMVRGPGIIVGRKGNVGAIHWSTNNFYPIDTVFFVETPLPLRWIYQLLKHQTFLNSDAAVPGLNREQALRMKVLRPPAPLLMRYAAWGEPLFAEAELLEAQNTRLRAARDLLLPKLISGEIDVGRAEEALARATE